MSGLKLGDKGGVRFRLTMCGWWRGSGEYHYLHSL